MLYKTADGMGCPSFLFLINCILLVQALISGNTLKTTTNSPATRTTYLINQETTFMT